MAEVPAVVKTWIWPLMRLICLQILAHGVVLWLGWRGLHPEVLVARMLDAAHLALGAEAIRWMLGGVLGLTAQLALETYLAGGISGLWHSKTPPREQEVGARWRVPSPWETLRRGLNAVAAGTSLAWARTLRFICFYIPGLDYEVAYPKASTARADIVDMRDSCTFFWYRFGNAFPGLRCAKEFRRPSDIAHRMAILLREPLGAGNDPEWPHHPLWWSRGMSDFYLVRWARLKRDTFLLNEKELRISRIIAVGSTAPHRCFVYVECIPARSSGLHDDYYTAERLAHSIEDMGYASEHFALYNFTPYDISEAEDGSYERNGRVRQFGHLPERRVRYLTPYNFVITPNASPLRTMKQEKQLTDLLNAILRGERTPDDLIAWAERLPRNSEVQEREEGLS